LAKNKPITVDDKNGDGIVNMWQDKEANELTIDKRYYGLGFA